MESDRRARLLAALGFLAVDLPDHPAVRGMHEWLDSWNGIRDIARGMISEGFEIMLIGAPGGWRVSFFREAAHGGAMPIVGRAEDPLPWKAVQRAAWEALWREDTPPPARDATYQRPTPAP